MVAGDVPCLREYVSSGVEIRRLTYRAASMFSTPGTFEEGVNLRIVRKVCF